ncbi:MAG: transposase [Sphingomonas sp.]|uniref:transposase n=1 Tax=Sphingomonas sp. TaxID=28214 RepID=UPI002600B314|nr:transposase [Sphingomonas sp.]MBX3564029.1 transposase [Sphingomonas sp.]
MPQRGNRRQQTFFEDGDFAFYRDLLSDAADRGGAQIWCYCLMPNHVHVIVNYGDSLPNALNLPLTLAM